MTVIAARPRDTAGDVPSPVEVPRWIRPALRGIALGIGALHTIVAVHRQSMNEDGINYLDMGSALVRGDWHTFVNAIWSPLYSAILGLVVHLLQPSVWWEFPVVQITNYAIFALTLLCFEFFWRELTHTYYAPAAAREPFVRVAPVLWLTLGYSLWIWSSLTLIEIWSVTPDMLVAACVYVAGGLLLRTSRDGARRSTLAWLGILLGVGYLAKGVMFPLGLAALVLAVAVSRVPAGWGGRLAWSVLPFATVAGALVLALSIAAGHVTFGDVGRFTYLKHVNRLRYPHWEQSIVRVNGRPEHAPRRVFEDPRVYEFAEPVAGTYPMSFDPGYWSRGLSPRFDVRQQLLAFASNATFYFDLFVRQQGSFAAVALLLGFMALRSRRRIALRSGEAALVLWALCAFAVYAPVYVTGRYVAPFVVLVWSGVLACVALPDIAAHRRLLATGASILIAVVWINVGAMNLDGLAAVLDVSVGMPSDPSPAEVGGLGHGSRDRHPEIADALLQLGVRREDRIGFIGYSFTAFWARLARVRIVAEIEPQDAAAFWSASSETQSRVLRAFAAAGAVAVVSEPAHIRSVPSGWQQVGQTEYLVHFLPLASLTSTTSPE